MSAFSFSEIIEATGATLLHGAKDGVVRGVSTDTRTLKRGDLFVALVGERFDGNTFLNEAFEKGAAGALVSRAVDSAAGPCFLVPDTLLGLGALAARHRRRFNLPMIAITGSIGKTTTKEMAAAILSQGRRVAKNPGNYNNEIGLPLALLSLDRSDEAAVFELAMRGPGQIRYLAHLARPTVGVITNIGHSHLELLRTREAIAEAKAELLAEMEDGVAILNSDDEYFSFLRPRAKGKVVSFGLNKSADVRAEDVSLTADAGVNFTLRAASFALPVSLRSPGRHNVLNALGAAAAALAAGAQEEWIAPGLASFSASEMRMEVLAAPGGFIVINDCYNAAPDSMRVAIELLAELPGKHKFAVLGDMKELGETAPAYHCEVGRLAADAGLTTLFTVGELGREIAEGARAQGLANTQNFADNGAAAAAVRARIGEGDVVLVKGSRAMAMETIVQRLLDG